MEQGTLIQAKAPAAFVSFCGYDEERCLGTIIYVSCGYTRKLVHVRLKLEKLRFTRETVLKTEKMPG